MIDDGSLTLARGGERVGRGVVRGPDGRVNQYDERHGLPATRVDDLFLSPGIDGALWVSTSAGLSQFLLPLDEQLAEEGGSLLLDPAPQADQDRFTGITWVSLPGGFLVTTSPVPSRREVLLEPFEISRGEINQAQWAALTEGRPFPLNPTLADRRPMTGLSREEITAALDGHPSSLRLPLEAEWEWAAREARPAHRSRYPWGATAARCGRAWGPECGAAPVSTCLLPLGESAHGLCDLIGNASEWVVEEAAPGSAILIGGGVIRGLLALFERSLTASAVVTPEAGFRLVRPLP